MQIIHDGRKHKIYSNVKIPQSAGKNSKKGFLYFLRIGELKNRLYKIGTTNNILLRMKQHCAYYKEPIFILWISPLYSKYTTLRIEDRQKENWIKKEIGEYIENDRFIISKEIDRVIIKVIKEFEILLE